MKKPRSNPMTDTTTAGVTVAPRLPGFELKICDPRNPGETLPKAEIGVGRSARAKCWFQGYWQMPEEKPAAELRRRAAFHHRRLGLDSRSRLCAKSVRTRKDLIISGERDLSPKKSNRCLTINPACWKSGGDCVRLSDLGEALSACLVGRVVR